jgi:hypothetical protein
MRKFVLLLSLFAATLASAQQGTPPAAVESPPASASAEPASASPTNPSASASPGSAPAPPAPPVATAGEEYALRMKQLESSIAELKEQIFRSKAKLTLLTEQVQGGSTSGARLVLTHKNQMGDNFLLVEVDYFLDGSPLWQEVDDTGRRLTPKKEHLLWDGNLVEGPHTLTVELKYKGNGTGAFQYLAGYQWKLKDAITFTAEPGKLVVIDAIAFEQGNFTTEMTERPRIRFEKSVKQDSGRKSTSGETTK